MEGITRREALKISGLGLALGGLAIGNVVIGSGANEALADDCNCQDPIDYTWTNLPNRTEQYSYFETLDPFKPFADKSVSSTTIQPLGENEMRITFMGSCIPTNYRRLQQEMSVFVELGWNPKTNMPLENIIFDCGMGVSTNFAAMNVGFGRMNKIFINHLHDDHMSDLSHIYCFGPAGDRKYPLYVWGPMDSGVESPRGSRKYYQDGVKNFCWHMREMCRWHTESFSFQTTSYREYEQPTKKSWGLPHDPVPVSDDKPYDAYAVVPIELDWRKYGKRKNDNVAYWNRETGCKVTHFPVIHARRGSIGYKLEWTTPSGKMLSMIYTSDTKPEYRSRDAAINGGKGVDVLIHEMIVPAQVWAMKMSHITTLPPVDNAGVEWAQTIQNSSHSPQGAFGYYLSTIQPKPRLTVATHFPVANDTVECAMKSVEEHVKVYQGNNPPEDPEAARMTWSFDQMVISVTPDAITELRGDTSDFNWSSTVNLGSDWTCRPPKYHDVHMQPDPYQQIDTATEIPSCEDGKCNYRDDGF